MYKTLLFGLLFSCGEKEETVEEPIDADGDGFVEADDCDDSNANTNPDSEEVCDGIDNNCDDIIDNDATDALMFYADNDGDGFGDADRMEEVCEASDGYVDNMDDCNDLDAAVNPESSEICDEVDNDCDGNIDDADEDVDLTTGTMYYADSDIDGFGDMASGMMACSTPDGYVENWNDCDDTDVAIGATDVDLDGILACMGDCDDVDPEVGATDADEDGFIACVDDCDDGSSMTFPGAAENESNTACMRDMDEDGFGDVDVKNCIQVEMFDTYGDAWNGSPPAGVGSVNAAGEVVEAYSLSSSDDCEDETATICDLDVGNFVAEGYLSVDFCATTEDLTLMYMAGVGTSYNDENSIRITDSDGMVWEFGPRFMDATTGDPLPALEEDQMLTTIAMSAVVKGSDCDDADVAVGSGDLDGDGYDACNAEDPLDCDDEDAAVNPGVDADSDGYNMCMDCDETDAAINPGADEVWYDGIDSDCDGWSDYDMDMDGSDAMMYIDPSDGTTEVMWTGYDCDDETSWFLPLAMESDPTACYADYDGDGYGDMEISNSEAEAGVIAGTDCYDYASSWSTGGENTYPGAAYNETNATDCTQDNDGDGYGDGCGSCDIYEFTSGTDCDDSSEFTYPGAAELESDPTLCMEDADEDGYGAEASIYDDFESGMDCDDDDAAINPAVDGDADGASVCTDCDDTDGAIGEATLTGYEDIDGDGYGSGDVTLVCSLDEDGDGVDEYVSMGGDCYDSSWNSSSVYIYPGAAYNESDPTLCAEDSDGDGYGDMNSYYADALGTDCDDDDEFTFPGAAENELSPLDLECLTDADEDGYAQISGYYVENITGNSPCHTITIADSYGDGCDGIVGYYIAGALTTSFPGPPANTTSSYEECSAIGLLQVGWTEATSYNNECSFTITESASGVVLYSSNGTLAALDPTSVPSGTDSDDTDATIQ